MILYYLQNKVTKQFFQGIRFICATTEELYYTTDDLKRACFWMDKEAANEVFLSLNDNFELRQAHTR